MDVVLLLDDVPSDPNQRKRMIEAALEVVVQNNQAWYRSQVAQGVEPPCCSHCGGVEYKDVVPSGNPQPFKAASEMFATKTGHCGDICAWDCAVMREKDKKQARVIAVEQSPDYFHTFIEVRTYAGTQIEDPVAEWTGQTCSVCSIQGPSNAA